MLDEFWALITGFNNVEVSDTLLSSFETLVEGNCFQIFTIINNTINISVVFWEWNFWIQGYINLTLRYIPSSSKWLYQFKVSIELHVCLSHTLRITKLINSSQFNMSKMLSCFILHFSIAEVKHEKHNCTKAFRLLDFMLFPRSFFTRHFLTSLCHLSSMWEQSGCSICKPFDRLRTWLSCTCTQPKPACPYFLWETYLGKWVLNDRNSVYLTTCPLHRGHSVNICGINRGSFPQVKPK